MTVLNAKAFLNKRFNYISKILCIIILNTFIINSTLIGEKKSLESFTQEFKGELKAIQSSPWSFSKIDYKTYNYENPGLGKIIFSNFNLYFSYFNIDKLKIKIDNQENYILEDSNEGTFTNILSFEYKTGDKENKGQLKISTNSMIFSKKFYSEDYIIKQSVAIELSWKILSVDLPDESIRELIENGLADFLNKVATGLIKQSLETDVKKFYDNLNQKKSSVDNMLILNGYTPNIEFRINVAYDKVPQLASPLTNFTIFSRSGVVNDIPHQDADLPKFVYGNDSLTEVAISRFLFTDIIGLMTNNGLFDYSINANNLYLDSAFDLNVDFLENVIPEISYSYSRIQKIEVYNVIKQINFDRTVNDKFLFSAYVEIQIKEKSQENIIFKFSHNLNLELKALITGNYLNFYMDSVNSQNIKIISNQYSFVNLSVLNDYLIGYYNLYFKKNQKFYLFKKAIDLSSYSSSIATSTFTQYGFNMLFDSKVKSDIHYLRNEIREKPLKFLGEN
jgi:hypothetical protein